jgi:L,D-transpeptidase catalytic domain
MTLAALIAVLPVMASPAQSQSQAQSDIVFVPGNGSGEPVMSGPVARPMVVSKPLLSCTDFASARERLEVLYGLQAIPVAVPELADSIQASPTPANRLDKVLLDTALDSYNRHICRDSQGRGFGPSQIVIVDFAKPSSQPRLYAVDLLSGQGLDTPVLVAHGVGSDSDDDGIAERFSNIYNSLASSLGAARGGELYTGINGLSLRLDGLDQSNSGMRLRDIVAHSYAPERRRYFNASLVQVRGGKPGMSEGCFVVAPHLREWLFGILRDGGFLFAGLGGDRAKEMPVNAPRTAAIMGDVVFVPGTGG